MLSLGTQGLPASDADELEAWRDWQGSRVAPKELLGEAFTASAAWQCVAACDLLARGEHESANVSVGRESAGHWRPVCAIVLNIMKARVILITGANGELGCAIGRAFLDEAQANVVWLAVHHRRERADQLAQEFPDRCRVVVLDVREAQAWKQVIEQVVLADARLDVLVNNAGIHNDALLGMMTPGAWRDVLSVNLDGVFHGCQAVLPTMISQRGGRIINIASLSALLAPAGQTNHAAAKAGWSP